MSQNNQCHLHCEQKPVIIIVGPTASGKTDLSFALADHLPIEIINADVGQLYQPFSVGVAKPDWQSSPVPCHLFDILQEPVDLNVVQYRTMVLQKVREIHLRGNIPVIVGGSHFYVQSLFYPPHVHEADHEADHTEEIHVSSNQQSMWHMLQEIDPVRASQIHPHDTYRIQRALQVWHTTGKKPSELEPTFKQEFIALVMVVNPDNETLRERIAKRAAMMIRTGGWLKEVQSLLGTPWEAFMTTKKLIGYRHIAEALRSENIDYDALEKVIEQETWDYAKRQKKFIKRMIASLEKEMASGKMIGSITNIWNNEYQAIAKVVADVRECYVSQL